MALFTWPALVVIGIAVAVVALSAHPRGRFLFRWAPVPLWCYGLPMLLNAAGWLPAHHPAYPWLTTHLLPLTLSLLLMGTDLIALRRVGLHAAVAMSAGVVGIVVGGPLVWLVFREGLPADSWKGIGILAATWTGGSFNMVALRTILDAPDAVFAPLVVVDALIAYGWMACLVALKRVAPTVDGWLRATPMRDMDPALAASESSRRSWIAPAFCLVLAVGLSWICWVAARLFPVGDLVTSRSGWTIVLVSTGALALSCVPRLRAIGLHGTPLGYLFLYIVLAALGAQASLNALIATPLWIVVGVCWVLVHAAVLAVAGRWGRIPFGVLATASQANVGGVVSAPLVGAVYDTSLAAVGLLLALAANAAGTYLGLVSATLCRWLSRG